MGRVRGFVLVVILQAVLLLLAIGGDGRRDRLSSSSCSLRTQQNYADALEKCILFFEGQRSGKLPSTQRMTWRSDSALLDGQQVGVDLSGGYYDAGDNVKFGFPMAFTTTVLSWSVLEFGDTMGGQLGHARDAVRWATDYLLKATSQPNTIHIQVGDPYIDHNCWERPEDMDTNRTVFTVTTQNPGSEVAGETAAALAAASMVFKSSDPTYANQLLQRAYAVFNFADQHRGAYSDSLRHWVCPFYCDYSGYMDELLWAAAWLYKATNNDYYWQYVLNNIEQIDWAKSVGEFGWDDKHAGIYVLISQKMYQEGWLNSINVFNKADDFACTVLPESPTKNVQYSPGGLMFKSGGSNMQHPTSLSFLLVVYARYLTSLNRNVTCGGNTVIPPSRLLQVAEGQVDYILGNNPLGMSYMVGYGNKFPQRIHHRGSSLPSVSTHQQALGCKGGTPYYRTQNPNPNLLVGALVGGPNITDDYPDDRSLFVESEPTTYLNAPMVGLLAYLSSCS